MTFDKRNGKIIFTKNIVYKDVFRKMAQETKVKTKKSATKIGAIIILVISALVFLPFGASAIFQSLFNRQKATVFGSYNGRKIVYAPGTEFYTVVSNMAKSYERNGRRIDDNSYLSIMREAFYQTVFNMAIQDAIKESGYEVSKEAINRAIVADFTDPETGLFNQKLYNQVSSQDINSMRKDAEANLSSRRFFVDMFGSTQESSFSDETFNGEPLYGLKKSDNEKKFIAAMGEEKKSFSLVSFSMDDFPKSEAAVFGKANPTLFTSYHLSVITVDDESDAKSILKQINANELTFEDAASEKSEKYYSNSEGNLMGSYRYQIEEMLENTSEVDSITSLETGEMSGVIKTGKGYSIFLCEGESFESDFDTEEVQDAVLSYLNSKEKGYIENYYIGIAENFITEAALTDFDSACKKFDLEKTEIEPFPINYKNSSLYASSASEGIISSISSNAEAYTEAFSLHPEGISSPFILDENILVLKCTGVQTEETEPVSESAISDVDLSSANSALFKSDKFKDNFISTYISLISSGR